MVRLMMVMVSCLAQLRLFLSNCMGFEYDQLRVSAVILYVLQPFVRRRSESER